VIFISEIKLIALFFFGLGLGTSGLGLGLEPVGLVNTPACNPYLVSSVGYGQWSRFVYSGRFLVQNVMVTLTAFT